MGLSIILPYYIILYYILYILYYRYNIIGGPSLPPVRSGLEFRHRLVVGLNYNPWSSTNPRLSTAPGLNSGECAYILLYYIIYISYYHYNIIGGPSLPPFRSWLEFRHRLLIGLNYNPWPSTNPRLSTDPGLNSGERAYILYYYYTILYYIIYIILIYILPL